MLSMCHSVLSALAVTVLAPVLALTNLPTCNRLIGSSLLSEYPSTAQNGARHGSWNASMVLDITTATPGWQMTLRFSRPLETFTNSLTSSSSTDNRQFVLRSPDTSLNAGSKLTMRFSAHYDTVDTPMGIETVYFNGRLVCRGTGLNSQEESQDLIRPPVYTRGRLKYNYAQVLNLSLLFYEAQRSGLLPEDNRVKWRGDSGPVTNDDGSSIESLLSAGYYTSGRTLKFTFPTAAAMTVLAWGILSNKAGYEEAGQLVYAQDALNWGAEWLANCYNPTHNLHVLVGDVVKETKVFWGRPEDLREKKPVFAVNETSPGSEVAAEVAAALAASSVVLREYAPTKDKADLYVNVSKQLYEFAKQYRGDYSKAVPQVAEFYRSWSSDEDELVWAAVWLFRATGDDRYRNEAQNMYTRLRLNKRTVKEFSWDEKTLGVQVLLSRMTLNPSYETDARRFCDDAVTNPEKRTPLGLFNVDQPVGSLRYASNAAFACYELGEQIRETGATINPYAEFAIKQIHYVLGDTGRSFLVGFGRNPPTHVHHSASSCPAMPAPCGWEHHDRSGPNYHVLYGAMVGGPGRDDKYNDKRDNWQQNDVGIDYNAAFQSLVAGLLRAHVERTLPNSAYV